MLLTEIMVLAVLSGVAALGVVGVGGSVLSARLLSDVTAWPASMVDSHLVMFAIGITLALVALLGFVPIARSRGLSLTAILRQSTSGVVGGTSSSLRIMLLATQ